MNNLDRDYLDSARNLWFNANDNQDITETSISIELLGHLLRMVIENHRDSQRIFNLLEPLSKALIEAGGPDIRGGFARGTGGVDIPYIVDALTATAPSGDEAERVAMALDLIRLAERCEKATGPDRELDACILAATSGGLRVAHASKINNDDVVVGDVICTRGFVGSSVSAPRFTASLDHAVKLIPAGWAWLVEYVGADPYPPCAADLWVPAQREDGSNFPRCRVDAATPSLALCAAALRAHAASADTHPKDGDVQQAPLVSGAVPEGQTPND